CDQALAGEARRLDRTDERAPPARRAHGLLRRLRRDVHVPQHARETLPRLPQAAPERNALPSSHVRELRQGGSAELPGGAAALQPRRPRRAEGRAWLVPVPRSFRAPLLFPALRSTPARGTCRSTGLAIRLPTPR